MKKISRRSLRHSMRELAATETPTVDAAFTTRLEQHLRSLSQTASPAVTGSNVRSFPKRASRAVVLGLVGATLTAAGAAAVAVVVVTHNADAPRPATTTVVVTTTTPTTTTVDSSTTSTTSTTTSTTTTMSPTTLVIVVPPTSVAATTTSTTPPTTTSTIAATTEPPTTVTVAPPPPATTIAVEPTSSTEVHPAATIALTCAVDAGTVSCSWTPSQVTPDHYLVLRSTPSETRGRVLTPDPGVFSITDTQATDGIAYTYLIQALDAGNHSVAHSNAVVVQCCQPPAAP